MVLIRVSSGFQCFFDSLLSIVFRFAFLFNFQYSHDLSYKKEIKTAGVCGRVKTGTYTEWRGPTGLFRGRNSRQEVVNVFKEFEQKSRDSQKRRVNKPRDRIAMHSPRRTCTPFVA